MPDGAALIGRASPDDLMLLASDVGPAPMQAGAVLVLDAGPDFDLAAAKATMAARITAVPRLRQRLVRAPLGCGRPIWIDDQAFDIGAHVRSVACQPPGDDAALLETVAATATQPLPWSRPLWSATFVTGLTSGRIAIIVVFHHVLADGIGGLAVLASLVDGAPSPAPAPFPRPAPSRRDLAVDALGSRLRALAHPAAVLGRVRPALAELNPADLIRPARTMLNAATGPARRILVTRTELGGIVACAHAHGATVNDVVLAAVARVLRSLLASRGERMEDLVASVMVTGRPATTATQLGNQIGVMPVRLPAHGDRSEQIEQIAATTRARKTASRAASAGLLRPAFRTLAALGLLRWLINRQRLVNVFVTNLRGPADQFRFAGAVIADVIPVTDIAGNVTLSFGVMSYAGTLVVVVVADPDRHPDLDTLAGLLQSELDDLAVASSAG
ncbi:MAG TPA: wax ester/triacylglycerol synthase domain-containing protein [Streptosporangiaceae bacterium]|nr:wax ester/triacylglycerol synthase domain-containing protein [Streptosporangiaceae bacterium]